jgi:hypothetical protein
LRFNFECPRLIDRSRIDGVSGRLLNGHGFAGDSCLLHERSATDHNAIDGNMSTRFDDDGFTDLNLIGWDLHDLAIAADRDGSGEKIEKTLDRPPASNLL